MGDPNGKFMGCVPLLRWPPFWITILVDLSHPLQETYRKLTPPPSIGKLVPPPRQALARGRGQDTPALLQPWYASAEPHSNHAGRNVWSRRWETQMGTSEGCATFALATLLDNHFGRPITHHASTSLLQHRSHPSNWNQLSILFLVSIINIFFNRIYFFVPTYNLSFF